MATDLYYIGQGAIGKGGVCGELEKSISFKEVGAPF